MTLDESIEQLITNLSPKEFVDPDYSEDRKRLPHTTPYLSYEVTSNIEEHSEERKRLGISVGLHSPIQEESRKDPHV